MVVRPKIKVSEGIMKGKHLKKWSHVIGEIGSEKEKWPSKSLSEGKEAIVEVKLDFV